MTFEELEQSIKNIESLLTVLVGEQKEEKEKVAPPSNRPVEYYTRKDVSELLNLSFPTLNRYSQLGIIPSCKVGNRVLYRLEDIQAALKKVPAIRNTRTLSNSNSHD